MATVYLARDLKHERDVAVKVLRPELSAALGPDRFLQEIRLAANLTHPHVLPLHDSGEADGLLYYVMPYVPGESLRARLERERRLPLADALDIAREVADALDYAHRQNVVHRDIKPENILLESGHAVVADFGIARAISMAGGRGSGARMTATGIIVGTPDYMSPEQAAGEGEVDGRSDVYSLGCVLYEMLVGEPPYAGASVETILSGQIEAARSVTAERSDVPLEIELAIETALARRPAERYRTAAAFEAALAPVGLESTGSRRARHRRRWLVGLAATAVLAAVGAGILPGVLRAGLDRSLYVVVPFGHRGGAAPTLLTGDRCEEILYAAFGRWEDVRLVNDLRVHDLRSRRGERPMTLSEALAIARETRSGYLVWGEVAQIGDSIQVHAALYDVARGGATVREHTLRFSGALDDIATRFSALADSLVLGKVRAPAAAGGALGTRVLSAWQAYEDGHAALAAWDLVGAEQDLRRALTLDPEYPHANLWLAQTLAWAGEPALAWRDNARAAATAGAVLGGRDQGLLQALTRQAEQQYPAACVIYRRLIARDSLDFAAWFGLGECQAKDRAVVRDAASPSGWRFRTSYQAAAGAYQRALELVPSVHRAFAGAASQRLNRLFFTETNIVRLGLGPDSARFGAFPALAHDTLAFVPYPIAEVYGGRPDANPPTVNAAVARNREVLRRITASWVRAFPGSADAHESLAKVLETAGELAPAQAVERSALAAVRRGRGIGANPDQQLRLTVQEVRILVKAEQFADGRELAESLLAAHRSPTPSEALELAGIAALIGRVHRAADFLRQTAPLDTPRTWDERPVAAPLQVKEPARALLAYASAGAPMDSLRALTQRVEQRLVSWVEPQNRERIRLALLNVPAQLAFPQLGVSAVHRADAGGNYLTEMQWALAQGDTAEVRARFARLMALRATGRPGDVSIDATYNEAWLLLALRDTAAATQLLDLSLNALPTLGTGLLHQVPQAAGLVRAMALRAQLAARAGDRPTLERWARAARTLWARADAALRPMLDSLQALTGPGNHD